MNPAVLALQKRLLALGHDPGPLDGLRGPKTNVALAQLPHLLDISACQPTSIDWHQAKEAGLAGAIVRLGGGISDVDTTAAHHWEGALAAGLLVGGYYYLRADRPAVAQAVHAVSLYLARTQGRPSLPLALDCERVDGQTPDQVGDEVGVCLREITRRLSYKRQPWLYTGKYFATTEHFAALLGEYPIWEAAYLDAPTLDSCLLWQFQGQDGRWPGVPGAVDTSVFFGSPEEFQALAMS